MADSGVGSLGKKIADLRVIDLKSELDKRGLEKTGVKLALIERLKKALSNEGIDPDEWELVGTSATPKTTLTRKAVGEKMEHPRPADEDGDSRHSETQPEHEGSSDMVDLNVEDDSRPLSDDDENRADISTEREMEDALLADDSIQERSDEANEEIVEPPELEAFERDVEDELLGHDEEQEEEGHGEEGDGDEEEIMGESGREEEMEQLEMEEAREAHNEALLSLEDTDVDLNASAELMGSKSATDVTESEEPTETATPAAEPVATETPSARSERVERKTDEELFLLVDDDLDNDIIGSPHAAGLPHSDAAIDSKPSQQQQPTKKMAATAANPIAKKNTAAKSQPATGVAEKKTDGGAAAAGTTGNGNTAEDSESATAASSVSSTPSKSAQKPEEQTSRSASLASSSSRNLWVSGLSAATRAADLKALFSKHGKVTGAKIVTNAKSPGAKCYGFVTLATTEEASKCIQHLHRTELHGRMISVERAKTDPSSHAQMTEKRPVQSAPKTGEGTPRGNLVAKRLAVTKSNAETPKKPTAVVAKPTPSPAAVKQDEPVEKKPLEKKPVVGTEETKKTLEQKEPAKTDRKVAGDADANPVTKDNKDQPRSPKRTSTTKPAAVRRDNGPRVPVNKNTRRSDFRERMRQRMWEQRQRELERKRLIAMEREKTRQRMMQREQQEEAIRLERERERLRLEKQRLELDRLEAERERILLERERQKRERERLELAREEERRRIEVLRHQELLQQRERAALKRSHDLVAPSSSSYWQNSKRPAVTDYAVESRHAGSRAVVPPSSATSRGMPDRTGRPADRSLDRRDADRRHDGLHSPDRTPRAAEKLRDRSADARRSGGLLPTSSSKLAVRLEHPRSAEHPRQIDRSRAGNLPHSADRSRDHGPHTPNMPSSGGRSEWKAPPTGDRTRTSHQSSKVMYATPTSAHASRGDGWHSAGHASSSSASKLRGGYNSTPSGSAATAHWSDRSTSAAQPHSTGRGEWSGSRTVASRGGSSSYLQPPASNAMMSGSSRVHQGERFSAFKSSALPSSANRRY